MSSQPEQTEESYTSILLSSVKSPGFWSVVTGGGGVAALVIGGAINLAFDSLSSLSLIVLLIGAILIFLAIVLSPRAIAIFLVGRRGRYGTNVAIMTIAFFVILLVLNFLIYQSPTRIDTTATRIFTLSPQTLRILDEISSPVMANAFFVEKQTSDAERQQAEDLLNEFQRRSDNFSYRFIDPELNRAQALKYDVRTYPTIVFEDADSGKLQGIMRFTEQEFVTGILVASDVQQKKVRVLIGHGEASQTDRADTGLDFAIEGMQRDNYRVLPLNLKQVGEVPEDTAVLIIAGPDKDIDDTEFEALTKYVTTGGHVLALYDPGVPDGFNVMLATYGLAIGNQPVADAVSNVGGEMLTPMLQKANGQLYGSNRSGIGIADEISVSFFPEVGPITSLVHTDDLPSHIKFTEIGITTPASWLETDSDSPGFSNEEMPGPFVVAGVLETQGLITEAPSLVSSRKPAKIVIFADSDFATNKYFHSSDNADLFLNSVNWLADDYELISIRPKLVPYRELVVNSRERDFIKWSSWVLPPALALILGIFVWWRRR